MNKKICLLTAIAAVLVIGGTAMARITGTQPTSADIFCTGPSGAEVCVDASGNIVPTTTNDASAGTSSLRFSNVYSTLGNFSGAITASGGVVGSLTGEASAIADGIVTSVKLAAGAVATSAKLGSSDIVYTQHIADAQVTSVKLGASNVVYTAQIADSQVTSAKILDATIAAADLASSAVTSTKVQSYAVTSAKLGGGGASEATGTIICGVGAGLGYCSVAIDTGKTCTCVPFPSN